MNLKPRRKNFVANVIWQKKYAAKSDSKLFSESHDYIIVYAKNIDRFSINRILKTEKQTSRYVNKDNDPRGPWKPDNVLRNEYREYAFFEVTLPSGEKVVPPPGTSWRYTKEKFAELIADNRIWFGVNGTARPAIKRFISEVTDSMPPVTIWPYDEVGHNDESKKESKLLFQDELFGTPKPERLIQRVLHLATNPGDLVLDSFLGSGTTAAVAHKMGRRWIGIELGEHCYTHCIPRLQKVINGEDTGGITKAQNWQGGGGFRFYELAPSLIKLDPWDIPVINPAFNAEMLAEAVCKLHGYRYAPSMDWFWMHGEGHKNSHIFVTTQTLTTEILQFISDQVGESRSLLICCPPCPEANANLFPNISLSIMPNALLKRYEWDHDDYSLNVKNLPQVEPQPSAPTERAVRTARGKKAEASGQISLLDLPQGGAE